MRVGIFLEGSPKMGGGFFQSLKSLLLLFDIDKFNSKFEVIFTSNEATKYLKEKKIKTKLFKLNFFIRYFAQLFEVDLIRDLFYKFKINHPFTNLIRKNNYDLIIFLGPSLLSKYCAEVSFVSNIWDVDHIKNNQFPEHNLNFNFENKEKLYNYIIRKAFKIIVAHQSNKKDLVNNYKADDSKIIIQNFIPMLPTLHKENLKKKVNYTYLYDKFNLPKNKKIIFYPAQFWAHKNHKYLIDTMNILKREKENNFFFIFCGENKGNYKYINSLIEKNNLGNFVKNFQFLNDNEVVAIYLNCDAVVMPTYCGPTNLPIYESFYFKKIIFYSKDLIDDKRLNEHLINIDISDPEDFYGKLKICFNEKKIEKITKKNFEYFKEVCSEEKFKENYVKLLDEFSYLIERWK